MKRLTALFIHFFTISVVTVLSEEEEDIFRFRGDNLSTILTQGREKTLLEGNARLETNSMIIRADKIELSGKNFRYALCHGRVSVHDEKNGIFLKSNEMLYDREKKIGRLTGYTEMEDTKNALIVRAGFFEYREKEEQMVMQRNVRIFKKDLTCRSDNAIYDREKEILKLSGLPLVYRGSDEYKAAHITVNLKTEEFFLDGQVSGEIVPEKDTKSTEDTNATKDAEVAPDSDSTKEPSSAKDAEAAPGSDLVKENENGKKQP